MKIYPGKGRRFIRRDGRFLAFIDQKSRCLYDNKKKAQRLTWTQAWRRRNKKGRVETMAKKKGKKVARVFKGIAGVTVEDLKKKREVKPEVRKAQQQTALREIKEKQKKAAADKKKVKSANVPKADNLTKVPKQRRAGKQAVKSTQR